MKKTVKDAVVYIVVSALLLLTCSSCNHGSRSVSSCESEPSTAETSSTDSALDTTAADSTTGALNSTIATPTAASHSTKASAAAHAPSNAKSSTDNTSAGNTSVDRIQYPVKQSKRQPITKPVDISKQYFRSLLTSDEQQFYDFLLYYAERCDTRLIYAPNFSEEQFTDIVGFMYKDNPQLFWQGKHFPLLPSGYSVNDHVYQMDYSYTYDQAAGMQKEIDSKTNAILAGIPSNHSQYDTELYLHDYLAKNCKFAWGNEQEKNSNNIYGALFNKKPASDGYAKAMQYLLTKVGIPCIFVTGTAVGYHSWNIVYINNAYYQLDVVRDDMDDSYISHRYFNVTTEMMLKEGRKFVEAHFRDYPLPQCTATADNYFVKNNMIQNK